jgi:hypothetical protein
MALERSQAPVRTPQMVEFMGEHRELPPDRDRAKVNIVSALSHDKRFQSVSWRGGRAWWHANRPVPVEAVAR